MSQFICDEECGFFNGFGKGLATDHDNASYMLGYNEGVKYRASVEELEDFSYAEELINMKKNMEIAKQKTEKLISDIPDEFKGSVHWKLMNAYAFGVSHGIQIQSGSDILSQLLNQMR